MKMQETVKFFGHIITVIFPLEYWRLLLCKKTGGYREIDNPLFGEILLIHFICPLCKDPASDFKKV